MNKKIIISTAMVASVAAITIGLYVLKGSPQTNTHFQKRLAACGSLPNGSSTNVTETTRMFINLPKDIYPNINLQITPRGATAGYISNGGLYGYAIGARGKPNCWSYYLEFDRTPDNQRQSGKVDIGAKSGVNGVPDYLIHFNVVPNSSDVTTSSSTPSKSPSALKGIVHGQVLLGPTCPAERIPPDPACAPKPDETMVEVFAVAVSANPVKTVATDASGYFNFSLDPGEYVLRAKGGSLYPRCADTSIKVSAGTSQNVILNCDTGIR